MSDWREHNGGPPPVDDETWVEVQYAINRKAGLPESQDWTLPRPYRILNQHLIDAARLEGIRLGLDAAEKAVSAVTISFRSAPSVAALRLMKHVQIDCVAGVRALNPDTIAREAVLDQLTSEAQADNMGYDNEPR